jgi:hypothetical protein
VLAVVAHAVGRIHHHRHFLMRERENVGLTVS